MSAMRLLTAPHWQAVAKRRRFCDSVRQDCVQTHRLRNFIPLTTPPPSSSSTVSQKIFIRFVSNQQPKDALFQAWLDARCMSEAARAATGAIMRCFESRTYMRCLSTRSHQTFAMVQQKLKKDGSILQTTAYTQSINEGEKQAKMKRTELATRPSSAKASTLVHMILPLSSVKEEVYGALDSWSAWEIMFPLVAVKKALKTLKDKQQWQRIIQVSKWMLSKGQGKTLGTYDLLIQALDEDGRLEEAEVVWNHLVLENIESVPRMMYARMIAIYEKRDMFDKLLRVFKEMEDMSVKPDEGTINRVSRTYEKLGLLEKKKRHLQKYSKDWTEVKFKGKKIRVKVARGYGPVQ